MYMELASHLYRVWLKMKKKALRRRLWCIYNRNIFIRIQFRTGCLSHWRLPSSNHSSVFRLCMATHPWMQHQPLLAMRRERGDRSRSDRSPRITTEISFKAFKRENVWGYLNESSDTDLEFRTEYPWNSIILIINIESTPTKPIRTKKPFGREAKRFPVDSSTRPLWINLTWMEILRIFKDLFSVFSSGGRAVARVTLKALDWAQTQNAAAQRLWKSHLCVCRVVIFNS